MIKSMSTELQSPVGLLASMKNMVGYEDSLNTKALTSMDEDTKPTIQSLLKELDGLSTQKLLELMSELANTEEESDFKQFGYEVLTSVIEKRLKQDDCSCDSPSDLQIVALQNCFCGIKKPHLHCTQCGGITRIGT